MTRIASTLLSAIGVGRRALFRRWLWGGAAVTGGAIGLGTPALPAEANRALFDPKGEGIRRVVTGNNAAGKSYVMKDERIKYGEIWRTLEDLPLGSGSGTDPNGVLPATRQSVPGQKVASRWYFSSIPPKNAPFSRAKAGELHRTASLGYVLFTSGEVTVVLDEGEVHLRAGDVLVMRNTMHAWYNAGPEPLGMLIAQVMV